MTDRPISRNLADLDPETMLRALQDSEARLRSVLGSASFVLWVVDLNGIVTFSEGGGLSQLGLESGEVVGRTIPELYGDIPEVMEDHRRALEGEDVTVVREIAGIVFESRYSPLRAKDGTISGVIGVGVDITARRRAAEAQGQTLSLLRATLESTADGILVVDATGKISTFNRKFVEMWGISEEIMGSGDDDRAIGQVLEQLQNPEKFVSKVRELYANPDSESFDVLEFQDGRAFERYSLPQRIGDKVVGRVWSFRDISERRRADEALRNAESVLKESHENLEAVVAERTSQLAETNRALEEEIGVRERAEEELRRQSAELEAIFLALPDLYFRLADDGRILDHRSGRESSLVLPEHAYVGQRIHDLLPESIREEFDSGLREVAGSHQGFCRLEYSQHFEDGLRHFELRMLPLGDEQVITVVRDITERHRAELALRKSEEQFRKLIENSTDVATILGPDGINRYQSPSITYVLGYSSDEMIGTSAFDRIHPDDAAACREVLTAVMQEPGITRSVEFRYRHKDGSWRVLEARARTILADSAAEGAIINSRDVTDRRRYEEELRLAKEEAEQANRAKSEFLSRMSHELRTPMNSILGFGQLLERKELPADQLKSVEHILKAGRHLLNLINEVLEIARIEAGRQNISVEPVRVAPALQEARAFILPMVVERGLEIEEGFVDADLYVQADRQRLVQVLLNLLSNGIKYNRPQGTVRILCREALGEGGTPVVQIGVQDTGDGIPPDKVARLFVPFERLGAEQSGVEGTGLGLALSQRLTEAMGGRLLIDTTPGEGSTFWVELARMASPTENATRGRVATSTPQTSSVPRPPATILYIEDNLPNLALIETILSDRPEITLLSAMQGKLGLLMAIEKRPELILLDMHLPDLRGDEVLRRLQSDPRTARVPVVMVSADATPNTLDRLLKAGAAAYLTKPLDVGDFLETIDRFLVPRGD